MTIYESTRESLKRISSLVEGCKNASEIQKEIRNTEAHLLILEKSEEFHQQTSHRLNA